MGKRALGEQEELDFGDEDLPEKRPTTGEEDDEDSTDQSDDSDHEDDDSASGEDDDDDERLSSAEEDSGETDEEREQIRAERRRRRAQKKIAAREREDRLRRELSARDRMISDLTNRLSVIERRSSGTDIAQVDNALQQLGAANEHAKAQMKAAAESGDGDALVQASEQIYQIRRRAEELASLKRAITQNQRPTAQPLDPRLVVQAQSWMEKNSWYKPEGADRDSRIVRRLDQELADEGWEPTDPGYWQELTLRAKKELPHRFERVYNRNSEGSQRKKQIVGGSGSTNTAVRGKRTVTLSKERVEALKEAGLWEDKAKREQAIKEFQAYDTDSKSS